MEEDRGRRGREEKRASVVGLTIQMCTAESNRM